MDLVDLFIESDLSCNKSSYSLREDLLSQIINSMYKFFNPFISNGTLIRATLRIASRRACILYISKEIVITTSVGFQTTGVLGPPLPEISSILYLFKFRILILI